MFASIPFFRLSPRGANGLACDAEGVWLGPVDLVRAGAARPVLPLAALARVLGVAYGPQPEEVTLRLHRGLVRASRALSRGELALAGIEAVQLGLPDPDGVGLAKFAALPHIDKGGDAWEDELRAPAGSPGGGEWTSEDSGATIATTQPPRRNPPRLHDHPRYGGHGARR